jgi:hypothetical protein
MKETFILRTDWADSIFEMTAEGQAAILRNLFNYHLDPEAELELNSVEVRIVWKLLKPSIDYNTQVYDKRRDTSRENGAKGGRPNDPIRDVNGNIIPVPIKDEHFIYLIYDRELKIYKIGETQNLLNRRLTIKRPTKMLSIVAWKIMDAYTCQEMERRIKRDFIHCKVSGDWLDLNSDEVKQIIQIINPNYPANNPNLPNETLSVTDTVYDTVTVIDTDNDIEEKKERINVATKKSPRKVSKSSEDGLLFANWFAQKYWTHHLEATDQIKNGWGVTYDTLIKRGNSKNVIVKIIEWAKADSFWSKQFLSPNKLLDKKHGADMNHFDYFAIQIKTTRDKSNNVISDQVMNNVVEAIKLNQKG